MVKKMLIDAMHQEERRVTVVSGNKLEEFDFETFSKKQLKGNIYLARVTRVEPSLQAAFVEYGGNCQGFLAFNEIHPDYYQIPIEDREKIEEVEEDENDDNIVVDENAEVEEIGGDDDLQENAKKSRPRLKRNYRIQEVIKKCQVLLVQVVKEERGNKGASMTTYLSLAGRYCVLMPNTSRGGGVSRKITNQQDRKRLKGILSDMDKPEGMGVIIRTAGGGRTKIEVKRDYEYVFNLWDKIRDVTLKSIAPARIHEEASLIHRAIRDMYNKEIDEVIVSGDDGYKIAKGYMKELTPSHAKKVKLYKAANGIPLFQRYQVEAQISHIYDNTVTMCSGGSIVMNQTEALVAIDVNSGRSIKERNIGDTALKTNLEAAEEVARQLRLRDMAGLVVIDFIDMDDNKANVQVERRLKEALKSDRARIQVGRISQFGLLEMSRQRLRLSLIDATSTVCPSCGGNGSIPSTEVASMMILRTIEEEAMRKRSSSIRIDVPANVGFYLLNNKRQALHDIEINFSVVVVLNVEYSFVAPQFEMTRISEEGEETRVGAASENNNRNDGGNNRNRNKNRENNDDKKSEKNNSNEENKTDKDNFKNSDKKENGNNRNRNRRNRNRNRDFDSGENYGTVTPMDLGSNRNRDFDSGENSNKSIDDKQNNEKKENNKSVSAEVTEDKKVVAKQSNNKKLVPKKKNIKNKEKVNKSVNKDTVKKFATKEITDKEVTSNKDVVKKATAKKVTAKKAIVKKADSISSDAVPGKKGWWS